MKCRVLNENAMGASQAFISADMALAGIRGVIPPDEVVRQCIRLGVQCRKFFKETAEGGVATTPTGLRLQKQVFGEPEKATV